MKLKTIKKLKRLGLNLSLLWFALSAFFIYISADIAVHHDIADAFANTYIIMANIAFFIGGFLFYFLWQLWIKSILRKNGLDGLLER
ncbi:hypothetical protein PQO03_11250 [Lentisphaera profundi]|uniref:Uncharacterized protein n=1 Tax=Lentisphaera profundi TaxID=1658616 RepID=A0ABY7VSK0_9BACT|nr:hypothetical protein [Lentisphaera profundi]WDE96284.1 hypothetical protein PQO03_11250 [Lentisphaera profundi]